MSSTDLPEATAADLARWLLRVYRRVRVIGSSMEPTLAAGDVVLVDTRTYASERPRDLDIVVAQHPQQPELELIKRVEFTTDDGAYLRSDNTDAESNAADSRRFGIVGFDLITGKVVARVG